MKTYVFMTLMLLQLGAFATEAQCANTLDIGAYQETFSDHFRGKVDVTPSGPSRWTAHTPWHGDFGDAVFVNPRPGFPFVPGEEGLKIIARKNQQNRWESGLLSSRDDQRRGFVQSGGYFEARMKLPAGPGVWPAFWLASEGDGVEGCEIDIIEYYGHRTDIYHQVVHVWSKTGKGELYGKGNQTVVPVDSLIQDFHTYGAEITDTDIIFYLDRKEVWRTQAPKSAHQPMMLLVNLALGSGWPIKETPDPSILTIDYVKTFQKK